MKYIMTLIWAFILGQVAYYLGSQLTTSVYNFRDATLLGLVIALTVFVITPILTRKTSDKPTPH
ncbi:TPA: YjzD family protein [Streptococcus suis]